MLAWVIRGAVAAAVAGAAYVAGKRRGAGQCAEAMLENPEVGRAVLERLAQRHGAKLEMFNLPPQGAAE